MRSWIARLFEKTDGGLRRCVYCRTLYPADEGVYVTSGGYCCSTACADEMEERAAW